MNQRPNRITSLGITLAVIAFGLWLFWDVGFWHSFRNLHFGRGAMTGSGMGVVMILFWLIVLIVVIALISGIWSQPGRRYNTAGPDEALEILRQRYARGEIDKAEFDARRRDLQA